MIQKGEGGEWLYVSLDHQSDSEQQETTGNYTRQQSHDLAMRIVNLPILPCKYFHATFVDFFISAFIKTYNIYQLFKYVKLGQKSPWRMFYK